MDLLCTDPWALSLWHDSSRNSPTISMPAGTGPGGSRRASLHSMACLLPSRPPSDQAEGGPLAQLRRSLRQGGGQAQPQPRELDTIHSSHGERRGVQPTAPAVSSATLEDLPPGEQLRLAGDGPSTDAHGQPPAAGQAGSACSHACKQHSEAAQAQPDSDAEGSPDVPGTPDTPSEQLLETVSALPEDCTDLTSTWAQQHMQRAAALRAASSEAWERAQRAQRPRHQQAPPSMSSGSQGQVGQLDALDQLLDAETLQHSLEAARQPEQQAEQQQPEQQPQQQQQQQQQQQREEARQLQLLTCMRTRHPELRAARLQDLPLPGWQQEAAGEKASLLAGAGSKEQCQATGLHAVPLTRDHRAGEPSEKGAQPLPALAALVSMHRCCSAAHAAALAACISPEALAWRHRAGLLLLPRMCGRASPSPAGCGLTGSSSARSAPAGGWCARGAQAPALRPQDRRPARVAARRRRARPAAVQVHSPLWAAADACASDLMLPSPACCPCASLQPPSAWTLQSGAAGRAAAAGLQTALPTGQASAHLRLTACRAIGDTVAATVGCSAQPTVRHKQLQPGDSFLCIASDGVWDVLTNEQASPHRPLRVRTQRDLPLVSLRACCSACTTLNCS